MNEFSSITAVFPNICTGTAVSHVCVELCKGFIEHGVRTTALVKAVGHGFRDDFVRPSVPRHLNFLAYRLNRWVPLIETRFKRHVLQSLPNSGILWAFPGTSCELLDAARRRGMMVLLECTNVHQTTARRILAEEYSRLGMEHAHGITDEAIASENELLAVADRIVCQGPLAAESFIQNGVEEARIVRSSVGWSPRRFAPYTRKRAEASFNVLCVATVCVGKGPHLLAKAWRDAGCRGRLLFAGKVSPEFDGFSRMRLIEGEGIHFVGYHRNVASLMQRSDVFALATLQEGGPMATYEAAAMGMAIITTPMGAGAIIRDGIEGIVLDPHDGDAWVNALRRLARDEEYRLHLGNAARERAQEFTWHKVAERRLAALVARGACQPVGKEA